ncbi:MAG: M48 family metalloprotease [Magnetospirillum sp.]
MKPRLLLSLAAAMLLAGCVTHETGSSSGIATVNPGYRPDVKTDEAGIWLTADKAEADLRDSANRVRDPALNALVSDMVCKLAAEYCGDLRPYVVRVPHFNATASPNGAISIWSGLLIRARTESELAAVVGHEITHYARRHTLARFRNARENTDVAAVLGLLGATTGVAQIAELPHVIAVGNIQAFSRDNERESDEEGFNRLVKAGYEPSAAADVWKRILDLKKAKHEFEYESYEDRTVRLFVASHPPSEEREKSLRELAEKTAKPTVPPPDRLRQALVGVRLDFLLDEVKLGQFRESKALFELLLKDDPLPGQIYYALGELYRKRAKDDDELVSMSYFHQACEAMGAPPEAFRMVATIRWRRGEKELAKEYFRRYLNAAPDAGDRDLITHYLGS